MFDVPLSKMRVRLRLSVEVDFPLMVIPEEVSCQVPPLPEGTREYVRDPVNFVVSMPPRVSSAALPLEFGVKYKLKMAKTANDHMSGVAPRTR